MLDHRERQKTQSPRSRSRFSDGSASGWFGGQARVYARTDSNSPASAPHKLMIQYHHLEHALNALSMRFVSKNSCET
jgi:hypothetical protein